MNGRSVSYWQYINRPETMECDVVVVGGGIAGCSTAFWLKSLQPSLKVLLIERRQIASGASGRNAGFLLQGSSAAYATDVERFGRARARLLWEATLSNRNQLEDLFDGRETGFAATGSCTAAGSAAEAEQLLRSAVMLREDAFEGEFLEAANVNRLLDSTGFQGGLVVPTGAVVDPVRLVRTMVKETDVLVMERLTVRSVTPGSEYPIEIQADPFVIYADAAVLTINAYLPLVEPELAAFVRPVRAQMLATEPLTGKPLRMPVYSHEGYYYIRQLQDGRLLVGGARHRHRNQEVGYSLETTEALQNDLANYLASYFPGRADVEVNRRWAGTMGFSDDGLPVWGRLPEVPRALWVGGFTGHGMSIAFLVGKMMAELTIGETTSKLGDLFSSDRFRGAPGIS